MRRSIYLTCCLMICLACFSGCGSVESAQTGASAQPVLSQGGPADPLISKALSVIERMPGEASAYTDLASIYINKARKTGDFSLNRNAEEAVAAALKIAPNDLNARKLHLSLQATLHRFHEAIEIGKRLREEYPADSFVNGVLTDAYIETGDYDQAITAAQRMVDLKPNSSSYARVGQIRSLHGDHLGAVKAMELAARTADPADNEAQSWCLVQLGKEYIKTGNLDRAGPIIDEALAISPGYLLALIERSRILAARGDYDGAFETIADGSHAFLTPEAFKLRSDIEVKRGRVAEADHELRRAEEAAQKLDGDLHPFAAWWADRDTRLDEALEIAETDFAQNNDIYGADILAWCLYKKGRFAESKAAIQRAVRLDTKDARILYHAGLIDKALGNKKEAKRYLQLSLKSNPTFDLIHADIARLELRAL